VTDFARPIQDEIAQQAPAFAEDFSDSSTKGAWKRTRSTAVEASSIEYKDGEFLVTNSALKRDLNYGDFVLEIDSHFMQGQGYWVIEFRDDTYSYGRLRVSADGSGSLDQRDDALKEFKGLPYGQTNHFRLLVIGSCAAVYVNDQPAAFVRNKMPSYGAINFIVYPEPDTWTAVTSVAFDNLKIWKITDAPVQMDCSKIP
jgi:hypothetical protein